MRWWLGWKFTVLYRHRIITWLFLIPINTKIPRWNPSDLTRSLPYVLWLVERTPALEIPDQLMMIFTYSSPNLTLLLITVRDIVAILFYLSSTGPLYLTKPNLVITLPADTWRHSVGYKVKYDIFLLQIWLLEISNTVFWSDDYSQNGYDIQRHLTALRMLTHRGRLTNMSLCVCAQCHHWIW